MEQYYLCQQNELKEYQSKGFELDIGQTEKLSLLLVKQEGEVRAYHNSCPHLLIELNWQPDEFMSLENTHIQCSTHGALFQLEDGLCISGPCRGQSLTPLNIDIQEDGKIYLLRN